jgi:hypothetical protein
VHAPTYPGTGKQTAPATKGVDAVPLSEGKAVPVSPLTSLTSGRSISHLPGQEQQQQGDLRTARAEKSRCRRRWRIVLHPGLTISGNAYLNEAKGRDATLGESSTDRAWMGVPRGAGAACSERGLVPF